jgi:hypothetical protein
MRSSDHRPLFEYCRFHILTTFFVFIISKSEQLQKTSTHFEEQKQGMMLGGHPFFDDYDDQYYGSEAYNKNRCLYEHSRRAAAAAAAAAEEATTRRRRAEIERYYRWVKELEEQDKLRERQEYMRMLSQRHAAEEEYRRRAQEADMMRCRLEEEEEEEMRRRRQESSARMRGHVDNEEEQHRIVRGPDGRLYRMPVGLTHRVEPTVIKESPPPRSKTNPKRSSSNSNSSSAAGTTTTTTTTTGTPTAPIAQQEKHLLRKSSKKANKQKNGKTRITIIVEDASDSETEDEFKSVWRNRRPSPGEWMEPVEEFKSL